LVSEERLSFWRMDGKAGSSSFDFVFIIY
jgi:hypothetical protein